MFIHRLMKPIAYCLALTLVNMASSNAETLSIPLTMAIENCADRQSDLERLTCALVVHDALCYSSVIESALAIDDDRRLCLSDLDNPMFQTYLKKALQAVEKRELKEPLLAAYQQWQHNIATMLPMPLEPEYQFQMRRNANEQVFLYKVLKIPIVAGDYKNISK